MNDGTGKISSPSPSRVQFRHLRMGIAAAGIAIAGIICNGTHAMPYFIIAGILATVALSIDLLIGYSGELALGQVVPFGIGAYTPILLQTHLEWAPIFSELAGLAAAIVVAGILIPILRLNRLYLAIATLAASLGFYEVLNNWVSLTGGPSGLPVTSPLELGIVQVTSPLGYFACAWGAFFLGLLVVKNIEYSRHGRALRTLRIDPIIARAFAIPITRMRVTVWLISSAIGGVAGVIYGPYLGYIAPEEFGANTSLVLIIIAVLGGLGSGYGAALGAILVEAIPAYSSDFQQYSTMIYGVIVIIVMLFMPDGLIGGIRWLTTRLKSERTRHRARDRGAQERDRNDECISPVRGDRAPR